MTTLNSTVGEVSVLANQSRQLQQEAEKMIEKAARAMLARGEVTRMKKETAEAAKRMGLGEGDDMDWADKTIVQDAKAKAAFQRQSQAWAADTS